MTPANAASPTRRSRLGAPLPSAFYDRDTADVARDLLGAVLECHADGTVARGRIVEVEAYLGPHDPACHAVVGLTQRNRHLHGPPGTVYVYRIYGMHWCVNAVTRGISTRSLSTRGFGTWSLRTRRVHARFVATVVTFWALGTIRTRVALGALMPRRLGARRGRGLLARREVEFERFTSSGDRKFGGRSGRCTA